MSAFGSNINNGVSMALGAMRALDEVVVRLFHGDNAMPFMQTPVSRYFPYVVGEVSEELCDNQGDNWGRQAQVSLKRGDYLLSAYFACELDALGTPTLDSNGTLTADIWTPSVGIAMLEEVNLFFDGFNAEKITQIGLLLHEELGKPAHERQGDAIGDYGLYLRGGQAESAALRQDEDTLAAGIQFSACRRQIYSHLPFAFATDVRKSLRLVGIKNSDVRIQVRLRRKDDCVVHIAKDCGGLPVTPGVGALSDIFPPDSEVETTGALEAEAPAAPISTGAMSKARIVTVVANVNDHHRNALQDMQTVEMYQYRHMQEINVSATDTGERLQRVEAGNMVSSVRFAYRAEDRETRHLWCELGAYRGAKVLAAATPNQARTGFVSLYKEQEVIDAVTKVELRNGNANTLMSHDTDYLRNTKSVLSGFGAPRRVCCAHTFGRTDFGGGALHVVGDERMPDTYLNFSATPALTWVLSLRAACGVAEVDIEKVGAHSPEPGSNTGFSLAGTGLKGKVFVETQTVNWYKQASGRITPMFNLA